MRDITPNEKERLRELLRARLVECGWKDQLKMTCKQVVKDRGHMVTVEEIITEITPSARASVPDSVKKELLQKIRTLFTEDLEGL